jgi:hypothetical protein
MAWHGMGWDWGVLKIRMGGIGLGWDWAGMEIDCR